MVLENKLDGANNQDIREKEEIMNKIETQNRKMQLMEAET